ncbi:hypothetical protein NMP99_01275 [Glutamicibacter mishrai]|uniref:hypothetical protein n=1 Tax=Glutamicibacter mishrai TaxID=1775880 RepID=UPI0020CE289A|nr:hypothetical protein [Glutamicibacter mishrai]UTT39970.1 hypothetical protein NMP99_01275 [Glutamicibacter mishrai]
MEGAFKALIELLDEMPGRDYSRAIVIAYGELKNGPSNERDAILRAHLRNVLAVRPGGISELYFSDDATKSQELIDAIDVVKRFARRRLRDFLYLPGIL